MTGYNGVYRGTNPYVVLKIKTKKNFELDFDEIEKLYITFKSKSGSKEVTKSKNDVTLDNEEKKIYVPLTQEDTLSFQTGNVDIQARFLMGNGSAIATSIVENYPIKRILKEGVI